MMEMPEPDESLRTAMEALSQQDSDIAEAYDACGLPPLRAMRADFAGLVRAIAAQQLSNKAAAAILARLEEAVPEVTPRALLALDETRGRALGLSYQKIRYIHGIAKAVESGQLDFPALAEAPDEEVIAALTALKGVGTWTAEVFLLFAFQRPDVFPAQDLALQVAGGRLKGLEDRPSAPALREIAEDWRPYRSAAARFLWHYYRHPGVA